MTHEAILERTTRRELLLPGVDAEYDTPLDVIVCEPSDEMFYAALDARGALYEGSFDPQEAKQEHQSMVRAIQATGARVHELKELMLKGLIDEQGQPTHRMDVLRELASHSSHHNYDREVALEDVIKSEIDRKTDLGQLPPEELVKILLLQPRMNVSYSQEGNMDLVSEKTVEPVYNITFMRDQMITTPNGIVLGRMNSRQRRTETMIVKFALGGLNIEPLLEIRGEGRLEGGDYLPTADTITFGDREQGEVVYLGNGIRTNRTAVEQLVKNFDTVFGDKMLAVVTDPRSDQDHMHLDTYMNILGPKHVLIDESRYHALPEDQPKVHLYKRGPHGKGIPVMHENGERAMPLDAFLKEQCYTVMPVTPETQLAYGVNFLTTGPESFIGVDIGAKHGFKRELVSQYATNAGVLADFIEQPRPQDYVALAGRYQAMLAAHGVEGRFLKFNHLNQAYGSIHCLTQVIRRGQ